MMPNRYPVLLSRGLLDLICLKVSESGVGFRAELWFPAPLQACAIAYYAATHNMSMAEDKDAVCACQMVLLWASN
jgi:hypothetical protein